ncbi:MAG: glycine cleavage system aminomethyltransferase GcvT [Chloroflexota bacterium]|nr:MAG: glycine cleavage system aminomethyltransferase GcvT [Chloroflexota bacterium]
MSDYLFRGSIADLDADLNELFQVEAERQYRKLILIPSESSAPFAVRLALASAFHNIYAEGYPEESSRWLSEEELFDYDSRLGYYRRYADPRYYKGVEYVNILEALARRRCAETFATNGVMADDLYVNVQALSGAPANNAIYHALVQPGDTIMGMNLLHGGHLTHGSPVNRSGKYYNAVHYTVSEDTERIDYEAVNDLAQEHKPRFIIAGYSSYPWTVDWEKFREIADGVGAILFADIAHVAGLVAAGEFPSPVGYADVITFTTHKSLCGPRGACILTTRGDLARQIDRAVFPGEQGGPHVNVFAALALTFKLAQTAEFRELQQQIVKNCAVLTDRLKEKGFKIPFGGTDTHLTNIDCKSVSGPDGTYLSGDQAARLLDLAGIVANRNTIPGDSSALNPSGVRMGTPWVTQRGLREKEMLEVADVIADLLQSTTPYPILGRRGDLQRSKVDFNTLEDCKLRVRNLAEKAGIDYSVEKHGYPHFFYIDDLDAIGDKGASTFEISGQSVRQYLNFALTNDIEKLKVGESQITQVFTPEGGVKGTLTHLDANLYQLNLPGGRQAGRAAAWLRDLSDGFIAFDNDILRKLPGPISIKPLDAHQPGAMAPDDNRNYKPYFIGSEILDSDQLDALPEFKWHEEEGGLRRTPVYESHQRLGAKIIPFAGWEMPVWYTSVVEEHLAVRDAAGLFDVAHMGVYQVEGPDAVAFLDSVVGNDIAGLEVGESLYTHFLNPDAEVIDDLLVYHRSGQKFLIVVNASNDDKDWAWLNAVIAGKVAIDRQRPWAKVYGRGAKLRNLRDPNEGADMLVDIALQGPRSREILLMLGADDESRNRIMSLKRTQLCEATLGDFNLVISRTGYTGEKMAFELFVHPDLAEKLFNELLNLGEPLGLKPCGLGARDSLRTEAGLPLYGHEMGGEQNLGVAEAGFASYVKTYKPWFIGRKAFLDREKSRSGEVVRFRFNDKGVRMAHTGDPVLDKRGRVVGSVTSCAIDSEGYLTGQAFVSLKNTEDGTNIYVFQGSPKDIGKSPAVLSSGDRVNLPSQATVLRRFPK